MKKLLCITLLMISGLVAGATVSKPEFSMEMPAGWSEMPQKAIADKMNSIPNKPPAFDPFNYGFQPGKEWFAYPYVLVQARKVGKIKRSDLAKMPTIDLASVSQKVSKSMVERSTLMQLSKPTYDANTNIVWLFTQAVNPSTGAVMNVAALIPTEYGILQFNGSALPDGFPPFLDTFQKLVKSVKVDHATAYR